MNGTRFFAPRAWVGDGWQRDVLLAVDAAGRWSSIAADAQPASRGGAVVLDGPVVPGVVNAHSHAFQRAIAGLTEQAAATGDDFWSWRDRMYSAALRITPRQLEAIAAFLYAELLAGGYTHVCEFHYLHNAVPGAPAADPLEMSMALVRAAQRAGIGLTLLPTLYMRSGFGAKGLRDDQRRFASTPDGIARLVQDLRRETRGLANVQAGVAVHSLRAADEGAIRELAGFAAAGGLPVHIHVAEQTQEVQDCLDHTGRRPIEWLLQQVAVDARWNLVHATHTVAAELQGVAERGASIVICPSTEANLGDGVFDLPGYAAAGGAWSIGSDSHVTRAWTEELRLLEYSQRLARGRRNVAAQAARRPSSAAALFDAALGGGPAAAGCPVGAIAVGRRADFAVLDARSPALLGVPPANLLDAAVFSSPGAPFAQVRVAGQPVAGDGHGPGGEIAAAYQAAMTQLWAA